MSKHDLREYRYAKKVDEDYPKIIKIMEECHRKLKPYREYVSVGMVIESLNDGAEALAKNFDYYEKILETKGKS